MGKTAEIQPFLRAFISVSFSHHHAIFTKAKDINERWFYIRKCAQEFWGYRRLEQALRDISKPMGVATYRSVDELPDTYRALPSAEELRKLL